MRHLESMETVLQDSQYVTPLTDGQIYVTYPSDTIDYAIVKKCSVKWSLNIIESDAGIDKLIPMFKSVEIDIVLKRFTNTEDDTTEDVLKKFVIEGKNIKIEDGEEENESFTIPYKPVKMDIEVDINLNCDKCSISFYDYSK